MVGEIVDKRGKSSMLNATPMLILMAPVLLAEVGTGRYSGFGFSIRVTTSPQFRFAPSRANTISFVDPVRLACTSD
ncbi:hypothetical protein [Cohnella abietis]|uniref:hypothetical protein n=1 Tax=Cohnella abietis TaxID=2507935 RepID=UPI00102E92FC|nr:hypothetical protein [Cohnella abietis]